IHPVAPETNPLRAAWGLDDAFVVGYSGNLGRAHEAEPLAQAVALLERRAREVGGPRGAWVFIAGGARMEELRRGLGRCAVTSARFEPYQDAALLPYSLSVADVQLISLRPELEGLIVPSKFYAIAAAGRASLFGGD